MSKQYRGAGTAIEYRRYVSYEMRAEGEGEEGRQLVGYAAVFNSPIDNDFGFKEIVKPGAFSKTLGESDFRSLIDHNPEKVLGRKSAGTARAKEDSRGLQTETDIPDTSFGRDLVVSVDRGDITGMSFGFRAIKESVEIDDGDPVRVLEEVALRDFGPVTFPAYPETNAELRTLAEKFTQFRTALHAGKVREDDLGDWVYGKPTRIGILRRMIELAELELI